ncbi:hypothetical protein [Clostridium baratii]|uniref:hypothetical protein n=1 Tax=Clostridium baratii TaxID=1561 RepID=UPI00097FAD3C|nr:hypothetical protein [Clostridium baratii]AQM61276.1 hypothetical protein NPD11_2109 [Clostridium baratii]
MRGENSSKGKVKVLDKISSIQNKLDNMYTSYTLFNVAKFIFYIVPAAFLIYIYIMIINNNITFNTIIKKDPLIAVTFINAMLNLFCALVLKNGIDELKEGRNKYATNSSFILIAISQILCGDIITSFLIFLGLYKSIEHNLSYKDVIVKYIGEIKKSSRKSLLNLIGSILILMVFILSFCFYIRIYSKL